ncbi:hypothetical protein FOZ60_012024 [Perkinsus olseni]|uniref:Uncharacterized protein n=1 Tax=Perkinsus olseni TaxID=32597 RepID=A0A7J6PA45_PEROL|nr:hypothetical protein FOZ60_012024 [Perkinsus olseni]
MSLDNVESSLRSTGDQIPADRLSMGLPAIIPTDGIGEPSEPLSSEANPDGELDNFDPVPRINDGTPAREQESVKPAQAGCNSSTHLDGAKREVQATPAGVADPNWTPEVDRKRGQRMPEILENVVKFTGDPGEDVEEWLGKLDLISGPECLNLNYHDQALLLRLSATDDAYQTVLMVRPGDPKTDPQQRGYLTRLHAQLRSRFGNSPDQAISQLCSISLANYKAIDDYAAAINRLVIQASPRTDGACQSTSVDIKASYLGDTSTFEEVVDKARLYLDTPSEDLTAGPGHPALR